MNYTDWADLLAEAWAAGVRGDKMHHRILIERANEIIPDSSLNPELEFLRFQVGMLPPGIYTPQQEQTEDEVLGMHFASEVDESASASGMKDCEINFETLRTNLMRLACDSGVHKQNLKKEMPHVMVMSTGRCGTVSLYRLLQRSHYMPYHVCVYNVSAQTRFETMCQQIEGNYEHRQPMLQWFTTRAAEWLGATNLGRPAAFVGHQDTIFAAPFAAIHPQSKFILLRREPAEVFASFYGKAQWSDSQLQPLLYKFAPSFAWKRAGWDLPEAIAWYCRFTEVYARALGSVVGSDRFIELSSNRLFSQNAGEIERLQDFLNLDLSTLEIQRHFERPYNEKLHKANYDPRRGLSAFERAYSKF